MRRKRAGGECGPPTEPVTFVPAPSAGNRIVRLRDLEPGSVGIIRTLSCRGRLRRRLMDLGIVAGTPIKVEKVAPLGDPVELKVKGCCLALRKEEAGDIWVEVGDEEP